MRCMFASFLRRVADWLDGPEAREKRIREAMQNCIVFPAIVLNQPEAPANPG